MSERPPREGGPPAQPGTRWTQLSRGRELPACSALCRSTLIASFLLGQRAGELCPPAAATPTGLPCLWPALGWAGGQPEAPGSWSDGSCVSSWLSGRGSDRGSRVQGLGPWQGHPPHSLARGAPGLVSWTWSQRVGAGGPWTPWARGAGAGGRSGGALAERWRPGRGLASAGEPLAGRAHGPLAAPSGQVPVPVRQGGHRLQEEGLQLRAEGGHRAAAAQGDRRPHEQQGPQEGRRPILWALPGRGRPQCPRREVWWVVLGRE